MYVSLGPILSLRCCFFHVIFHLVRMHCTDQTVIGITLWKFIRNFPSFLTAFFFLMWQTEIECIDDFCSIFQYCLRIQFGILERDWPLKRRWQWVIWFSFFRKCTTLLSSTFLLFVSLSFVVTFHEVKTMNDDLFHLYIFSYLSTIEWRLFQWWTFTMCACLCWIEIVNDQYDMEIQSAHWECWSSWQTW